jgi:hypothetical protein
VKQQQQQQQEHSVKVVDGFMKVSAQHLHLSDIHSRSRSGALNIHVLNAIIALTGLVGGVLPCTTRGIKLAQVAQPLHLLT